MLAVVDFGWDGWRFFGVLARFFYKIFVEIRRILSNFGIRKGQCHGSSVRFGRVRFLLWTIGGFCA